ncbi:hypothetical protein ACF08W_15975 [Streptomyces sp. NPDC015144]|uniref:DUF6630 family protein n=1 Tax=Streptomyces sp. NPDC015144 TaxID=3364944 RepID=UPI00370255D5
MSGTGVVAASLTAVTALLAPERPAVAERVLLAHDDPEGYARAYADELEDRGVDGPVPELLRIALVDALYAHGLLAEFDWKEHPEEIRAQLRLLDSAPAVDPWGLFEDGDLLLPTYDFLEVCGRRYREVGAALAVIDLESDCYPVVCLPAARAGELTELAGRAGIVVHAFGV